MIKFEGSDLLKAVEALQSTDTTLQVEMQNEARDEIEAAWLPALAARSQNAQDRAVIMGDARAVVSSTQVYLAAAQSETPLSGGLVPYTNWPAVEFGARTRKATFPQRSPKGKVYSVTKMINRGLPNRQKYARIAYDAASEVGTRVVGIWYDAIVDRYKKAVGDGS